MLNMLPKVTALIITRRVFATDHRHTINITSSMFRCFSDDPLLQFFVGGGEIEISVAKAFSLLNEKSVM